MARKKQTWRVVSQSKASGIQAFLGVVKNAQPLPDADRAKLELSLGISLKLMLKGKGGPKEYIAQKTTARRVMSAKVMPRL